MTGVDWPDATHRVPGGSAYPLTRGNVAVCGSALDLKAQRKLRDWLSQQIEKAERG